MLPDALVTYVPDCTAHVIMLDRDPAPVEFSFVVAGSLVLREGLPHPGFEKAVFDTEILRSDVCRIAGWPFYADPLPLRADTLVGLELLAADSANFRTWCGEKRCGGFHPDYALSWPRDPHGAHILLCFGCHEALFVAARTRRRVDLWDGRFMSELEGYRVNRPPSRGTG